MPRQKLWVQGKICQASYVIKIEHNAHYDHATISSIYKLKAQF